MRRIGLSAVFAALVLAAPCAGQSPAAGCEADPPPAGERRLALLIGNNSYLETPLKNAVNDAQAMRTALRGLGFQVFLCIDTDAVTMERALRDFAGQKGYAGQIRAGDIAVFYYAGHGVQVDGQNYLVPAHFSGKDEIDVKLRTVNAGEVLERMELAKPRLSLLILDACRDNPFRGFRSAGGRGLAPMTARSGSYIAFAAQPGEKAEDGVHTANGTFTGELKAVLGNPRPGTGLDAIFVEVRRRVLELTGGRQLPSSTNNMPREWYPWGEAPAPAPVAQPAAPNFARTPETVRAAADAVDNGGSLLARQNYEEAARRFDAATQLDPDNAIAFISRGLVRGLMGNHEAAIQDFSVAIRLKPNDPAAYLQRALGWIRAGDCAQALADLGRAIELDASSLAAYRHRAGCYASLRRDDLAERDLQTALELAPGDPQAMEALGLAHLRLGRPEQAAQQFDAVIRLRPDSARALLLRAEAREKMGDAAGAQESRTRARGLMSGRQR